MGMSLKLAEARERTPAIDVLGPNAQAMRQAALDAITVEDITAIIKKQVEKARAGDQAAAKFVLDYATGGAPKVQVTVGIRGQSQPRDPGPAPLMLNGNGKHDHDDGKSVGELRRIIARYLAKNGPTPEEKLIELFELEDAADAVLDCNWFERCRQGWHITTLGRDATSPIARS